MDLEGAEMGIPGTMAEQNMGKQNLETQNTDVWQILTPEDREKKR